jgi:putative membrane protein
VFWPWGLHDMSWLGSLLTAVFWIGLIVVGVLLLRRELPHMRIDRRSPALDLLEQRYARGEVSREEFLERRAVLLQERTDASPAGDGTPASPSSPSSPPPSPAGRSAQEPPAPPPPPGEPPQLPTV